MTYTFLGAEHLMDGIGLVAEELDITLCAQNGEITVQVEVIGKDILQVARSGKSARIIYGGSKARFFRGLALLTQWVKEGCENREITETPLFITNGAMIDMSRNAVMKVETVKFMMRKMALMGMNMFMLYTEDTYELENRPYFGYMRGRYTTDEIREMDAYARQLGMELIPCIQVLGHLATTLRWQANGSVKDTANALLVGEEETYRMIGEMFSTIASCFSTRRIHIGMDETHDLGTGAYLDRNGYRPRQEIFLEHLSRVAQLAEKYGLRPMMWSDMFFRLAGKGLAGFEDYDMRVELTDEIVSKAPKTVQQVFWDYYHPQEEFYASNLEKHKLLGENTVFAGGVWHWSGHCPQYSRSRCYTIPALEACRKAGVREVIATVWHNGSEASLIMSLAGLAWYADYDYRGFYDEEGVRCCLRASCGVEYDSLMKAELPEYPHGSQIGVSRALLYNDPLIGLVDKHLEWETANYYRGVTKELAEVCAGENGMFAPALEVILKLSSLLEQKADFGVRLKRAYDANDREILTALAGECDEIIEKIRALRKAHRASWMQYNKPFGWEVHDIRYGGLLMRFDTAKARIEEYLAGEISEIGELEAERLYLHPADANAPDKIGERFLWEKYSVLASVSIL